MMAKSAKTPSGKSESVPDPRHYEEFRDWLKEQPREWFVLATRAALRVLPLVRSNEIATLMAFRATAIAHFAAKHPNGAFELTSIIDALNEAYTAAFTAGSGAAGATNAALAAADAAFAAGADAGATTAAADAVNNAAHAARATRASAAFIAEVNYDVRQLRNKAMVPEELSAASLWRDLLPSRIGNAWIELVQRLRARGDHWSVWIGWYDKVNVGVPHAVTSEAEDAAFTDLPGKLPWAKGAKAVNAEIARRLASFARSPETTEVSDHLLGGPPAPEDSEAFGEWLESKPREWSVVIAARAALRVMPLIGGDTDTIENLLPVLRAVAIARFASKYARSVRIISAAYDAHARFRETDLDLVGRTARYAVYAAGSDAPEEIANSVGFAILNSASPLPALIADFCSLLP